MKKQTICIFGGTGFLGQSITRELANTGARVKIATRIPESAYDLKLYGDVGQIVPVVCDYNNDTSVAAAIEGCDIVINLIGILFQKGKSKFKKAHIETPTKIATVCANQNIEKFIHISALGVDVSQSKYAKSKQEGENKIKEIFPNVTILRPSVVFGPDDEFFNMFAKLASILPALPLIGGGKTKFQPVFVGDIADAVTNIVTDNTHQSAGKTYELGGPQIVSFKEIYEILLYQINRKRALISVPWGVAKMQGCVMGFLPKPPLTVDQVRSLKFDNIVSEDALKLTDLGVIPTAMDSILPQYLKCYKRGGRFSHKKATDKKAA